MLWKKEFKAHRWKYIVAFVILIILAITLVWQFPFIKNLLEQGGLEGMPGWMIEGVEAQRDFSFFLASNWFDKNLLQISVILSILLGMSVVAQEVEDNTLEFLLSRPFSRRQIFISKTLSQLVFIIIVIFIPTLMLGMSGIIFGYEVHFLRLIIGIVPVMATLFIVYNLALLFSLYLDDQIRSGLAVLLLIAVIWGLSFIDSLSFLNIFAYGEVTSYYVQGNFPFLNLMLLLIIGGVVYSLSYYRFLRRDF